MANWSTLESVQEHINRAAMYVAGRQADFHTRWLSNSMMESPIEAAFWVWWSALAHAGDIDGDYVTLRPQSDVECVIAKRRYRLDFELCPKDGFRERAQALGMSLPRFAVELDGHDYHERTREQVTQRNQRDRDLQADGWTVLHYSGSELFRDPEGCVSSAFEPAYRAFGWVFEQRLVEGEYYAAERAAANQAGAQLAGKAGAEGSQTT